MNDDAGDYGWDLATGENGDFIWSPEGDLMAVTGGALVAEDVRTDALSRRDSLFYALGSGSGFGQGLIDYLRSNGGKSAAVIQKLREAALNDERIDWETIRCGQYADGKYYLQFRLLGELAPQTLYFDLAPWLGERLGGGNA